MRRIILAALVLFVPPALLTAQSPASPAFEVASVKVAPAQSRGLPRPVSEVSIPIVRVLPGGRVESYGHMLRNLIAWAFDVNTLYQRLEGKHEVLETEFVISAKAANPSLTSAEGKAMMRALLEERFQLRWRLQPRDVDGYVLLPARDDGRPGTGMRPFTGDCEARASSNVTVRFDSPDYEEKARCGWSGINSRQRAIGLSTKAIAERLTMFMATPVSDRTGWPGLFTFDLLADTQDMPFTSRLRPTPNALGARLDVDAPQLLDVFRRELGLKLVKDRAIVNDFIIERIEPLIEN